MCLELQESSRLAHAKLDLLAARAAALGLEPRAAPRLAQLLLLFSAARAPSDVRVCPSNRRSSSRAGAADGPPRTAAEVQVLVRWVHRSASDPCR